MRFRNIIMVLPLSNDGSRRFCACLSGFSNCSTHATYPCRAISPLCGTPMGLPGQFVSGCCPKVSVTTPTIATQPETRDASVGSAGDAMTNLDDGRTATAGVQADQSSPGVANYVGVGDHSL